MARKIPAEQDKIGAPPYPVEDPVANADSFTEDGKAVIETGEQAKRKAFDRTKPGRDGSGPYTTTADGVILPDGSYVPAGATFDAGVEGMNSAALEGWQRSGLVVFTPRAPVKEDTKEFKGDLTEKG